MSVRLCVCLYVSMCLSVCLLKGLFVHTIRAILMKLGPKGIIKTLKSVFLWFLRFWQCYGSKCVLFRMMHFHGRILHSTFVKIAENVKRLCLTVCIENQLKWYCPPGHEFANILSIGCAFSGQNGGKCQSNEINWNMTEYIINNLALFLSTLKKKLTPREQ